MIFPTPAPSFDDPLGLLKACHGRIRGHCDTLERLVVHVGENGADDEARTAAERIRHYFVTAAPLHHQDEEDDLFPALRERDADLDVVMQNLEGQHQDMARAWSALEPFLAAPETAAADLAGFGRSVKTFCLLYRSHIEQEEAECFTHAPGLLDAQTLERIGKAMAARRNTGS